MVYPSRILKDLGPPPYSYGQTEQEDEVGIATSMVWTGNGGDIIRVEATLMEGKGNLTLTGQLGEVMQESAQTALSYARSHARSLGIDPKRFDKIDIHINVPEGAVPKDGPSAGITMATALVSALLRRPIRRNVAMTGEITLRGRVLPVGGVKEKVLGSHRAGVDTIVLPQKNERDLMEVPKQVRRKLTFVLVNHMDQVLETALCPAPPQKVASRTRKTRKPATGEAEGAEKAGEG